MTQKQIDAVNRIPSDMRDAMLYIFDYAKAYGVAPADTAVFLAYWTEHAKKLAAEAA